MAEGTRVTGVDIDEGIGVAAIKVGEGTAVDGSNDKVAAGFCRGSPAPLHAERIQHRKSANGKNDRFDLMIYPYFHSIPSPISPKK
jgi:hypothetical protein